MLDIYPSLSLILRYIYCLVFQGASSESDLESTRKKYRELSGNYEKEKTLLENLFQIRNKNDADLSTIDSRCLSIRSTLENSAVTYSNICDIQNKLSNIVSI
ncbi:hypothetical protein JZL99_23045, partial [Escherichia coli]|uniref:hypothetical protein n=1 Tax=Escherichia coli TaxID=562 RepID=UPI0019CFF4AB